MILTVNDLAHERDTRWWALIALNVVMAAASGVFGVIALVDPVSLVPGASGVASTGITLYAAMYGVRAVPLAVVLIVVAWRARPGSVAVLVPFLAIAGVIQLADAAIGAHFGTTGFVGGIVAGVVHLGSIAVLARWRARSEPVGSASV
jgi:hypothetical protein